MKQKLQVVSIILFILATQAICIGWVFGKAHLLITGVLAGIIGLFGMMITYSNNEE